MMRKCFLISETLGEVCPRSVQEEAESSREEMGCVCMNHSHGGCRSTWLLIVFANFLLHFCQESEESNGELKIVKMLSSSLTKVLKSSLSCLKSALGVSNYSSGTQVMPMARL